MERVARDSRYPSGVPSLTGDVGQHDEGHGGVDNAAAAGGPVGRATDTDRYVGSRMRARRITLGLSQHQFAQLIGVTYQQAHKYEHGQNRISAGRLHRAAMVLNVSIAWFFDGLMDAVAEEEHSLRHRMLLDLMRNAATIEDERQLDALAEMARVLSVK